MVINTFVNLLDTLTGLTIDYIISSYICSIKYSGLPKEKSQVNDNRNDNECNNIVILLHWRLCYR